MDFKKNIEEFDLCFLDLETTGLDVISGDSICEIGILKVRNNNLIEKFHSLINPKKPIPSEVYLIHRISDEDVKEAPALEEIAEKIYSFLKDTVVCAYNVEFDMGFLNYELQRKGFPALILPAIDILSMARKTLKLKSYNLSSLANFFKIDYSQKHRALADAWVGFQIFLKLKEILKEKNIENLQDFISLFGLNNEVFRVNTEPKILLIKEAISNNLFIKVKYFSYQDTVQEEEIKPLNLFQENRQYKIWYQDKEGKVLNISLKQILNLEFV